MELNSFVVVVGRHSVGGMIESYTNVIGQLSIQIMNERENHERGDYFNLSNYMKLFHTRWEKGEQLSFNVERDL